MALKQLLVDDTTGRQKLGGVSLDARSGAVSISDAASQVSVTFSSVMANANYALTVSLQNTADSGPQFQPPVITAKSASGFTVKLNTTTDSANYVLNYIALPFI